MGGDVGSKWLDSFSEESELARPDMVNGVAVRTKLIDFMIEKCIKDKSIVQMVVLGAGLDCRAWRMTEIGADTNLIEIDFPEVFEYKLPKLEQAKASLLCKYVPLAVDLALPTWREALTSCSSFDGSSPTLWLLEGLTGYLTEDELRALMSAVASLSVRGSCLLSTFVSPGGSLISLHRFKTDTPLSFLREFGWDGEEIDVSAVAAEMGRMLPRLWTGYRLCRVEKI